MNNFVQFAHLCHKRNLAVCVVNREDDVCVVDQWREHYALDRLPPHCCHTVPSPGQLLGYGKYGLDMTCGARGMQNLLVAA